MNSINTYAKDEMPLGFKLFKQGAEAKLYKGIYLGKPTIAKHRFSKAYRHENLDLHLAKARMKAESRAIVRCKISGIRTPAIYLVDFNRRAIFMEYFEYSITAKEFIEKSSQEVVIKLALEIGKILGKMHANDVTHGDLTTSNILLVNKNQVATFENLEDLYIVLIDFGLALADSSILNKGIDFFVLERGLSSTHSVVDIMFPKILESYQEQYESGYKEVFSRYEEVRARGRKRTMVG